VIRHAGVLFSEAPGRKPSVVMVNDTLTTPRLGYSRYLTCAPGPAPNWCGVFSFSRQEHRFETPPKIIERGINSKNIKCYPLFNQSASSDRQGGPNWTPPELASTAGSSCVVSRTLSFYKQFRSKLILSLMRSASFASAPHQMMRVFSYAAAGISLKSSFSR
jgi:hypothetical protein